MSFISLTSDLGLKDGSVARIKAKILHRSSDVRLIDISHQLNPFDLYETAYVVRNSYIGFPEKSVHLIFVDALEHPLEKAVCAFISNQFIISNNNGLIRLIASEDQPFELREIQNSASLSREDLFCETALGLYNNKEGFALLGPLTTSKDLKGMMPYANEKQIIGFIVYVDHYGNAISNIHRSMFEEVHAGRSFEIFVRNHRFQKLVRHYSDVVHNFEEENKAHGQRMALFEDSGFLEFAMYKSNQDSVGGASQILGLKKRGKSDNKLQLMDYGSNAYLVVKAIHIIFMVSYFAGLFYLLRLFVYHQEAKDGDSVEVLQSQFEKMIQKLWNIIIVPAGVIMLVTGITMLSANEFYLLFQPWMHLKLTFLLLFLGFHLWSWKQVRQLINQHSTKWSALQFRKINEIPTLFLMAIVLVVVLKQNIFAIYPKLIVGFVVIAVLIFGIIKIVNRKK